MLGVVLSSTRHVKKGPGRRPQSAKRQRFMELRARGWSITAAGREVGVSRSAAANWAHGYEVYRNGQVVGLVEPLDRLAVRAISPHSLSEDERILIADLRQQGRSIRAIAVEIGRAASTVSRELARNGPREGPYRPFDAHRRATSRRAKPRARRLETSLALRLLVGELLAQRWSAAQIARHLHVRFPQERSMHLCHESIYQAVYEPGSTLVRPPAVPSPHHRSPLRTGREHRRAHQHLNRGQPRFEQPMLSIHQRPFAPDDRSEAGHWEGDLIVGRAQGSVIGTLVERQTRTIRLLHLPARDADTLHAAVLARMNDLPNHLVRSITWDQGTEMARHRTITADLGAPLYFCDAHSPWQRGTNENSNGLLRQYFPKGTDRGPPCYDALIGQPVDNHRSSVLRHRADREGIPGVIGFGTPAAGHRSFPPSHERQPVHEQIAPGQHLTARGTRDPFRGAKRVRGHPRPATCGREPLTCEDGRGSGTGRRGAPLLGISADVRRPRRWGTRWGTGVQERHSG
jgi:IS30 family transposase